MKNYGYIWIQELFIKNYVNYIGIIIGILMGRLNKLLGWNSYA